MESVTIYNIVLIGEGMLYIYSDLHMMHIICNCEHSVLDKRNGDRETNTHKGHMQDKSEACEVYNREH